jgi:hypothetical protein
MQCQIDYEEKISIILKKTDLKHTCLLKLHVYVLNWHECMWYFFFQTVAGCTCSLSLFMYCNKVIQHAACQNHTYECENHTQRVNIKLVRVV